MFAYEYSQPRRQYAKARHPRQSDITVPHDNNDDNTGKNNNSIPKQL
jgi:hypothetical protein